MAKKTADGNEPEEALKVEGPPCEMTALEHIRAAAELLEKRRGGPAQQLAQSLRWAEGQIEQLGGNSWLEKTSG